ncbi:MAG: tyrosine-type recombinase/integrase [Candidatus Humimicrobiaceae bacterium]
MKSKQSIAQQVSQYLQFKRSCGYKFDTQGKELILFARYAKLTGHEGPLTLELAVRWAKFPENADRQYWAIRYDHVRRFGQYIILFDPNTEILPKGLLGPLRRRPSPHIYSEDEIKALLKGASSLTPKNGLTSHTYVTLFGLLLCTGLRISEALNLSCENVDLKTGILTIKETKFKKSRLVPVHPSTLQALRRYVNFRQSYHPKDKSKMFFLNENGTPVNYNGVLYVFIKLSKKLGLRYAGKKPRIHDMRHSFVARRITKWYQEGADLDVKILSLSTYLGHVEIRDTYWYLSSVPELLNIVSEKFENFANHERERNMI